MILTQSGILGAGMSTVVDLSYLSDNIMLLRYFEAAGDVKKAISVVKRRGGRHETTIRELNFANSRISVGAPLLKFHGVLTGIPSFTGSRSDLQESAGGEGEY
jgi:circadian clock protein KaiC